MSTPKNYILRDIPADLWRQVKVEAATEGVSVREVILRGLKDYTFTQREIDAWDKAVAWQKAGELQSSPRGVSTRNMEPLGIPSKITQSLHETKPSHTGRKRRKS
jgi:hypothetical protein